jgi:hypothetical protein
VDRAGARRGTKCPRSEVLHQDVPRRAGRSLLAQARVLEGLIHQNVLVVRSGVHVIARGGEVLRR